LRLPAPSDKALAERREILGKMLAPLPVGSDYRKGIH